MQVIENNLFTEVCAEESAVVSGGISGDVLANLLVGASFYTIANGLLGAGATDIQVTTLQLVLGL
jgi:hypothetical protein